MTLMEYFWLNSLQVRSEDRHFQSRLVGIVIVCLAYPEHHHNKTSLGISK